MFPNDSANVRNDFTGNFTGTTLLTIPTSQTYTILYESFNSASADKNATLTIQCGSTKLLQVNNLQGDHALERFKFAKCSSDITVTIAGTTGNPVSTISIIYTPYDLATKMPQNMIFEIYFDGLILAFISLFFVTWFFKR